MRRMLVVVLTMGVVLAVTSGPAAARIPEKPLGSNTFSVFKQPLLPLPYAQSFLAGPVLAAKVDTFDGPAYVVPHGLRPCLLNPIDDLGNGGTCGSLAVARRGGLVSFSGYDGHDGGAPTAHIAQLVPDGIGAIVAGGKTWPVVDNVAVAVVSYRAGLRYLQRAGSARGMRAYGFLNVR